jgi:hypothetical protein
VICAPPVTHSNADASLIIPKPIPIPIHNQISNGDGDTISTINSDHNIITNNKQIVNINVFGKEEFDHIMKADVLQKLKSYSKKGVYGLTDIINDIHCNDDVPQNNTIIKPLEYGDGVYIMGDDKTWEFREFEDIRNVLIESLSKYVETYNKMKKELGIQLTDRREKNFIKAFAYQLLSMEGDIPDDLFQELQINEDHVVDDTDKLKAVLRKFDKATMLKLHEYTKVNFKKENGKFIRS